MDFNIKHEPYVEVPVNNPTCDSDVTSFNITDNMIKIEIEEVQLRSGLVKEEQIDLPNSCNDTSDDVRGSRTILESEETNSTMEVNIKLEPDDDFPVNNPTCDSDVTSVNITDDMIKIETEEVQFRSDNNQPTDITNPNKDEVKKKIQREERSIDIHSDTKLKKKAVVRLQQIFIAVCEYCGHHFHLKQLLQKNIMATHSCFLLSRKIAKLKCIVCNFEFRTLQALSNHAVSHHKREIREGVMKSYKCDFCNKYFTLSIHLKYHVRSHTGSEKSFICDVCNKRFAFICMLKAHMRLHTGEKPFKCAICNKSFSLNSILKSHQKFHTGEKPFKCDVCNKSFAQIYILKAHKRIHTGEKPYKCDVCNKGFTQKPILKTHMRVHTLEKPFKCDVCNKFYKSKSYLKRHMQIHR